MVDGIDVRFYNIIIVYIHALSILFTRTVTPNGHNAYYYFVLCILETVDATIFSN